MQIDDTATRPVDNVRVVDGYSTVEVCAMTGATYRQIDYWTRSGIVAPSIMAASGHGSRRRWSAADVADVARVLDVARARSTPLAEATLSA